jgi:hypothetical protein
MHSDSPLAGLSVESSDALNMVAKRTTEQDLDIAARLL